MRRKRDGKGGRIKWEWKDEGRPARGRVGHGIDDEGMNRTETGTDGKAWKTTGRKAEGRVHK